jgi:tetratricopeptide (TPR) repeat protein
MLYEDSLNNAVNPANNKFSSFSKAADRIDGVVSPEIMPRFKIKNESKIFTIGSCFARNIKSHLAMLGFDIPMHRLKIPVSEWANLPSGILNRYDPPSIYQTLQWTADIYLSDNKCADFDNCGRFLYEVGNDKVIDLALGGFVPVSKERFLERRQSIYEIFSEVFSSDVVTITLGLTETWFDTFNNQYIHAAPTTKDLLKNKDSGRFLFRVLSYGECFNYVDKAVRLIKQFNENVKILITTSPVPLARTFSKLDVIVANMWSKSTLNAVCAELYSKYEFVDYFPSYESVMLTKSWEIWRDDRIHVNDEFVATIVKRLLKSHFEMTDVGREDLQSAYSFSRNGDFQKAREIIEPLALETDDVQTVLFYARVLNSLALHKEAVEALSRVETECRSSGEYYFELANAFDGLSIRDKALSNYTRCLELDGNNQLYQMRHLNYLYRNGMFVEIFDCTGEYLKNRVRVPWVYDYRATAKYRMSQIKEALAILEEGIEQNPASPSLRYKYSRILFESGDYINALKQAEIATELNPLRRDFHDLKNKIIESLEISDCHD